MMARTTKASRDALVEAAAGLSALPADKYLWGARNGLRPSDVEEIWPRIQREWGRRHKSS